MLFTHKLTKATSNAQLQFNPSTYISNLSVQVAAISIFNLSRGPHQMKRTGTSVENNNEKKHMATLINNQQFGNIQLFLSDQNDYAYKSVASPNQSLVSDEELITSQSIHSQLFTVYSDLTYKMPTIKICTLHCSQRSLHLLRPSQVIRAWLHAAQFLDDSLQAGPEMQGFKRVVQPASGNAEVRVVGSHVVDSVVLTRENYVCVLQEGDVPRETEIRVRPLVNLQET